MTPITTRKPRIVSANIGPMPRCMPEGAFDPMPAATVKFDDGTVEELFRFYPDEIMFTEHELLGLTRDEAFLLYQRKDVLWLQS
jgi:hypothetical protein